MTNVTSCDLQRAPPSCGRCRSVVSSTPPRDAHVILGSHRIIARAIIADHESGGTSRWASLSKPSQYCRQLSQETTLAGQSGCPYCRDYSVAAIVCRRTTQHHEAQQGCSSCCQSQRCCCCHSLQSRSSFATIWMTIEHPLLGAVP